MRVSLGGITNSLFHNKLYGKRIYCKSKSSWFMRTFFEKPVVLHMDPHTVESNYKVELNGGVLGFIEGFSDGILFNLIVEDNNVSIDCHRFLACSSGEFMNLSIRDLTSQALIWDYNSITCTHTYKKHMSEHDFFIRPCSCTEYYRMIKFDWRSKNSNLRTSQAILNPLVELRVEMSELRREQSDQNLHDIRRMTKEIKERHEAIAQEKPEESPPLPPTRNITLCKGHKK